ncbi:hypothetical protein FJU08_17465 [Martelella alba]|uniref:Uncharacterized protein n=1 Tax=Martelella alba TaxID=2590451 RepID=A0A506U2J7_9HYPH|nr:hypothetical protein [Martelella alba]TPW28592.1 hypothetical protein FJU08_17465 [Martelella alba]
MTMSRPRLYVVTDDAVWACLSVFGCGLYGLPEWAAIASDADAIAAIPSGSLHIACWHSSTAESRFLQRICTERWAARELITAPSDWLVRIEELIAKRDQLPDVDARRQESANQPENQETPKHARAGKWH